MNCFVRVQQDCNLGENCGGTDFKMGVAVTLPELSEWALLRYGVHVNFLLRSIFEILHPVYDRIPKLGFKQELKLERVAELSCKIGHTSKFNLRLL